MTQFDIILMHSMCLDCVRYNLLLLYKKKQLGSPPYAIVQPLGIIAAPWHYSSGGHSKQARAWLD